MRLREDITATDLKSCIKAGLQAIRESKKVFVESNSEIKGSINIDECLREKYPQAPRWDYVIFSSKSGFERNTFIEIHPAIPKETRSIIRKAEWLKEWFKGNNINLSNYQYTFVWVSSAGVHIPKSAQQRRLLPKNGILGPKSIIFIDREINA